MSRILHTLYYYTDVSAVSGLMLRLSLLLLSLLASPQQRCVYLPTAQSVGVIKQAQPLGFWECLIAGLEEDFVAARVCTFCIVAALRSQSSRKVPAPDLAQSVPLSLTPNLCVARRRRRREKIGNQKRKRLLQQEDLAVCCACVRWLLLQFAVKQ